MKRRRIIAGLIAVVVVGVIAWTWAREREPVYNGKKLSEWLTVYVRNKDRVGSGASVERIMEAQAAIRQIGTNGIPFLIKWTTNEPSSSVRAIWKFRGTKAGSRAPRWIWRHLEKVGARSKLAPFGFDALGDTGIAAVPALTQALESFDPMKQFPREGFPPPITALAYIGKGEGLPPVMRYIANPNNVGQRVRVVQFLWTLAARYGTNAAVMVPVLTEYAHDSDRNFALSCAAALEVVQRQLGVTNGVSSDGHF